MFFGHFGFYVVVATEGDLVGFDGDSGIFYFDRVVELFGHYMRNDNGFVDGSIDRSR